MTINLAKIKHMQTSRCGKRNAVQIDNYNVEVSKFYIPGTT